MVNSCQNTVNLHIQAPLQLQAHLAVNNNNKNCFFPLRRKLACVVIQVYLWFLNYIFLFFKLITPE